MTAILSPLRPLSRSQTISQGWKPYPAYTPSGVEGLGDVPELMDVLYASVATGKPVKVARPN